MFLDKPSIFQDIILNVDMEASLDLSGDISLNVGSQLLVLTEENLWDLWIGEILRTILILQCPGQEHSEHFHWGKNHVLTQYSLEIVQTNLI